MKGGKNLSFVKNRNYFMSALKTTGQLSDEVLRSMAPVTTDVVNQNTKNINNKILKKYIPTKSNYSHTSSRELIKNSIDSLKNDKLKDDDIKKNIDKIKNFKLNENMDNFEIDESFTDIRNIENDAELILRTNIQPTLIVIEKVSNVISSHQNNNLLKTNKYLLYINDFNKEYIPTYYSIVSNTFSQIIEKLTNIKDRLSILNKFERGSFQVNSKYNQLRTSINTVNMLSSDYYKSKLLGNENEAEEILMENTTPAVSPMISQVANIIKTIMPAPIQSALNETEAIIKVLPGILNDKYKKMMDGEDHLKAAIGSKFYLKTEKEPYTKGQVQYDGITRRALLNAIPSGLSKILNAISGETNPMKEKVFDYKHDVFMEAGTIMQHAKDESEFNRSRTDTPVHGYKTLVLNKLKDRNLLTPNIEKEVNSTIERINNEKLLPGKLTRLSKNIIVDSVMKETFMELPPYVKTRFMHHVFNVMKTPEEIISENESYHNVNDVIGLQDIIPKKEYDFKNEFSKYLIGKNYKGLAIFIDQKIDETNPYEPGTIRYRIVEGIRSANVLLSELVFGVPDGKRSEISIIGEKSLVFVGRTANKILDWYKVYIASDKRSAKILREIKETEIVQTTTNYLKLIWTETKESKFGKYTFEKLINPTVNFFKTNVFDRLIESYKEITKNIENKVDSANEEIGDGIVKKKTLTAETVYEIKIKKHFKKFNDNISDLLITPFRDLNTEIEKLNPMLDKNQENRLISIAKDKLTDRLKQDRKEKEEKKKASDTAKVENMSEIMLAPKIFMDTIRIITNPLKNSLFGRFMRSITKGKRQAKELRPKIKKRSIFKRIKDMIDFGSNEKEKRKFRISDIFKDSKSLAKNIIDLKFVTPFKVAFTAIKDSKESLWNIIKNTISIIVNFYTKFIIPMKLFGFYKNTILKTQLFFEAKRFTIAVRKQTIKEAISTMKAAIEINRDMKKVYRINPEYKDIGFTIKKFNIVGGYLDNIYQIVKITEYESGYEKTKRHLAEEKADDEKDRIKSKLVIEKTRSKISDRIKDRLSDITDMLMNGVKSATSTMFSGVGNFAKGAAGTLFNTIFKNGTVSKVINTTKSIVKGTTADMDSRIEHVYVIGGTVNSTGINMDLDVDLPNKKKTNAAGEVIEDVARSGKKGKGAKIAIGIAAGALLLGSLFGGKDEDEKEETKVSTIKPASTINEPEKTENNSYTEVSNNENNSNSTAEPVSKETKVSNNEKIEYEESNSTKANTNYKINNNVKVNNKNKSTGGINNKTLVPNETLSKKVKVVEEPVISEIQTNSSLLSSSMIEVKPINNVDSEHIKNYQEDKNYNEQVEKEFVNKLTSKEADEYYANKNAATLAAKLRMGENGVLESLLSKSSFGALATGGISLFAAKKIVDLFVKKSGIAVPRFGSISTGGGVVSPGVAALADGDMFGKVSSQFETGKTDYTGADVIGRVDGDAGGASYGLPMYTTNQGSAKAFSQWLAERYGNVFGNKLSQLAPGSSEFDAAWHEAYNKNPQLFAQAQEGYIVEKSTLPLLSWIQSNLKVDFNKTRALQEAAHATGIAYGLAGAKTIFSKSGLSSGDNEETLIKKLYQEKRNSVGTYKYLGCSKQVQESVFNRYHREEKVLLGMLGLPAVNLQLLLGDTNGVSNADNAVIVESISKLSNASENASTNSQNIRGIIKNIKTMQILKDDPEIKQLIEIISILDELSENTNKLANDDIMLRYSDKVSEDSNKSITNMFTGGHIGKLA